VFFAFWTDESGQDAMAALLGKFTSKVAKFALAVHLLTSAIRGDKAPSLTLPRDAIITANAIVRYSIGAQLNAKKLYQQLVLSMTPPAMVTNAPIKPTTFYAAAKKVLMTKGPTASRSGLLASRVATNADELTELLNNMADKKLVHKVKRTYYKFNPGDITMTELPQDLREPFRAMGFDDDEFQAYKTRLQPTSLTGLDIASLKKATKVVPTSDQPSTPPPANGTWHYDSNSHLKIRGPDPTALNAPTTAETTASDAASSI
jgi:hypothetical protein